MDSKTNSKGVSVILTDRVLGQLITTIPMIVEWMRNASTSTADILLQSYREDDRNAENALKSLATSVNAYTGDITMGQLQEIGDAYRVSAWGKGLTWIMTRSAPRLVSNEIGSSLIATLPQLHGATSVKEVCHILGPVLDQLSRRSFEALGSFCAMIRDTASDTKPVALLVGPQILMPLLSLQEDVGQSGSPMAAAALMDLLIQESEALFGRIAGIRIQYPFGISRSVQQISAAFNEFQNDPDINLRTLRAFYDWRDSSIAGQADKLFKLFKFEVIAVAIYQKYGMLPPGWLEALGRLGIKDLTSVDGWGDVLNAGFQKSEADYVIDEIASTEILYHKKLSSFIEYYAKPIIEIARGLKGDEEKAALGLSENEAIEATGGKYLEEIKDTSNSLMAKLEAVTLINAKPLNADGRVGLVLSAFDEMLDAFSCYIPYILRYNEAVSIIRQATKRLEKADKGLFKRKGKAKSFLKIWEIVSNSHPRLNGQSMESVLIEPIQRPPRYLILFKQLRKSCGNDHPNAKELDDMLAKLDKFNTKIDSTLAEQERREAKLKQIYGVDAIPRDLAAPTNSKTKR